jgi:hypothetical protein
MDPRELVSAEVFEKLTRYIIKDRQVSREYAERMFGQTLVFLKAYVDSRRDASGELMRLPGGGTYRVVPDVTVDVGWHAFLQHTEDYVEFCQRLAGEFIHHRPVLTEEMRSGAAMKHTLPALHATGYRVDLEFWRTAESCCPPECAPPGGGR